MNEQSIIETLSKIFNEKIAEINEKMNNRMDTMQRQIDNYTYVIHNITPAFPLRHRERLCSSILQTSTAYQLDKSVGISTPIPPLPYHAEAATQTLESITHPFTPSPPAMTADHKPTRPRLHSTPLPTELHPGKFNARPSTTMHELESTTHTTTTMHELEASLWFTLPSAVTVRSLLASSSLIQLADDTSDSLSFVPDTTLIFDPGSFTSLSSPGLGHSFPFDPGGSK